jgi:aspartate/methionine/tyrosine aminotransferase
MPLSKRSQVDPFIVMDVMEAARAAEAKGRRIVHMEVGQPSTSAPLKARQAVAAALPRDAMGYTVALGLPELRAEIAALYKLWYDEQGINCRLLICKINSSMGCWLPLPAIPRAQ